MKFNLKLFVLVGVLAGFRDVCGTEKDENFYVNDLVKGNQGLIDAVDGKRVIKAVYKTEEGGDVDIIYKDFKNNLSKVLVWDGNGEAGVEVPLGNNKDELYYNMKQDVEYTVYFIFKNELLNSTAYMFYWCESLISADFRYFNTSNVTDMYSMFHSCSALEELNLSSFSTSKVENMSYMFAYCSHLTELDLSFFKTQSVTDIYSMFLGCTTLTKLDLSNFDTTSVTNMYNMFSNCSALKELNLSTFDTKNVTDMSGMFSNCSALKELNLSSFNTTNVKDMSYMFRGCTALKELDLRNFYFSLACKMDDILDDCNFNNLCIPQTYAKTRKRCWCCCCRYVYLKGKVVAKLNKNNVEFEVVQDDLIGS